MRRVIAIQSLNVHHHPTVISSDGSSQNLIQAQHELRFENFKEANWDARIFVRVGERVLEVDEYDGRLTVYLARLNTRRDQLLASLRVNPTLFPYLLQHPRYEEARGFIADRSDLVERADVAEASRFCIRADLSADEKARVLADLRIARAEFMRRFGITQFLAMTRRVRWQTQFESHGWSIETLGCEIEFGDGSRAQAYRHWITDQAFEEQRSLSGISEPILDADTVYWPDARFALRQSEGTQVSAT